MRAGVVLLDFDGTCIEGNTFHTVRDYLIDTRGLNPVLKNIKYFISRVYHKYSSEPGLSLGFVLIKDFDKILYRKAKYHKSEFRKIAKTLVPVSGLENAIKWLHSRGYEIYVVSYAQVPIIREFFRIHGLADYIKNIIATRMLTDRDGYVIDYYSYPVNIDDPMELLYRDFDKHEVLRELILSYEEEGLDAIVITDFESNLADLKNLGAMICLRETSRPEFEEIKKWADVVFKDHDELLVLLKKLDVR